MIQNIKYNDLVGVPSTCGASYSHTDLNRLKLAMVIRNIYNIMNANWDCRRRRNETGTIKEFWSFNNPDCVKKKQLEYYGVWVQF